MDTTTKKAQALINKVNKKIATNEYNMVTIYGEKLTRSDLEEVVLYAEDIIEQNRTKSATKFMRPMGRIEKVLIKSGAIIGDTNGK